MTYTLTKGTKKVRIRIDKETAEAINFVGEGMSTSKTILTPTEATRQVNDLIRQGYKAQKR